MKKFFNVGRLLLLSMILFPWSLSVLSQTSLVTVGTGTATNNYLPIYTYYSYNYTQSIYTVADLTAAGLTPGVITKIGYKNTSANSTATFSQWAVYATPTTATTIGGDYFPVAAANQIFNGAIPTTTLANDWMMLTLSTPLIWDGVSNIIITISENTPNYLSTTYWSVFTPSGGGNKSRYYYDDFTTASITSPPSSSTPTTVVPQLRLEFEPIASPPAFATNTSTPSCLGGLELSLPGTPPTNISWYWQDTPTGTSTSNPANSPWIVYGNGTFYARSFNSSYNAWSPVTSYSVTNFPLATAPQTPLPSANPACMPGTDIHSLPAPAGHVNYWQGTNPMGMSTTLNATTPYPVSQSGTYYIKSFEQSTGCWSVPVPVSIVVDSVIPGTPQANPAEYNYCLTTTPYEVSVQGPFISTSCQTSGSASGTDASGVTVNLTNFSCATGQILSATLTGSIGYYCASWYGLKVYVNGNLIANNVCLTTPIDLMPYWPITSVQLVSQDNDNYSDGVTVTGTVTINYTTNDPTIGINWYSAATGGTQIGSVRTPDLLGSSLIPIPVVDSYVAYAESYLGGCVSVERVPVTVNVSEVNVEIAPLAATCNSGIDGSFSLTDIFCGNSPMTYSVDGGSFSTLIPNNLAAGMHTIVVRDANNLLSPTYNINIPGAAGPSNVVASSLTSESAFINWVSNAQESEWFIEWGPVGFEPGTGSSAGSGNADSIGYLITGLLSSTDYVVYVSANCGPGTTFGDWAQLQFTTDCLISTVPWCEDFEPTSTTRSCWKMYDLNNNGTVNNGWQYHQWTYWNNSDVDDELALSGVTFATHFSQGSTNSNDYLVTPQLALQGGEAITFNYAAFNGYAKFKVLMSTTGRNPQDFTTTLMADAYYTNQTFLDTLVELNHVGNVYIAFVLDGTVPSYDGIAIEDFCLKHCVLNPGVAGEISVCRSSGTIDMDGSIESDYDYGTWTHPLFGSAFTGSVLNVNAIASGTYDVEYVVVSACMSDTTIAALTVVNPSSAGENGLLSVCRNQPISLFGGLSGNVDYGGSWYTPDGILVDHYLTTANNATPGQYIYKYIVANGICEPDTSEVMLSIQNCNWLGLDDEQLDKVAVYPNPSSGKFQINGVLDPSYSYEIVDLHGRLIQASIKLTSSITMVDISTVETGVYLLKISNEFNERLVRIIKQ